MKKQKLLLLCLFVAMTGTVFSQTTYTPDPTGFTQAPDGYRMWSGTKYYGSYDNTYIQARILDNGDGTVKFVVRKNSGTFQNNIDYYLIKDPSVSGGTNLASPDVVKSGTLYIAGDRGGYFTFSPRYTSGSHYYSLFIKSSINFFTKSIKLTAKTQKLDTPDDDNFYATSILYNGFTAHWDAVPGATGYRISVKRASEDGYNSSSILYRQTTSTNSYKVTGLAGNAYQFQVQATVGSDESAWSTWSKSGSIIRTLNNMSVTSGNSFGSSTLQKGKEYTYSVTVKNNSSYNWFGSFYLKGDGIQLEWNSKTITAGSSMTFTQNHTFTATGSKTLRLYILQGARGDGEEFGNPFTVNVVSQTDPTKPSSPYPSNGATNVSTSGTFSWSTSAGDGGNTLNYDLYLDTNSSFSNARSPYAKGKNSKSCPYSGLQSGTKYYWKVIVYNGSGGHTTSDVWTFTTASSSPSDDMTADQAAQYLYDKGVIENKNVDNDILRQDLAKVAFRGLYYAANNGTIPSSVISDKFPTVYEDLATQNSNNSYYFQAAKALLYLEYGDGVSPFDRNRLKFDPTATIQRIHVLKVLLEAFDIQPKLSGTDYFSGESDIQDLASRNPRKYGYVRSAGDLGIINTSVSKWRPYDLCTRGEAFLMLVRIMEKVKSGKITNPNPNDSKYFQPLNTTLKTIAMGTGLQMGNFQHYTKTSFVLDGVTPLVFAHTYNSYNTTLPEVFYGESSSREAYLPLADGWSHTYHTFITEVDDNIIVHWGGGGIDVYNSALEPVSMGVYDKLTLNGSTFVIKTKSQVSYYFGTKKSGVAYLTEIVDRNKINKVTISYETGENNMPRISSVSDGNGRQLTFAYKRGTNLISSVTDPLGRHIEFGYMKVSSTGRYQLSGFKDAMQNDTRYYYGDDSKFSTSKLLTKIRLPKGNYITNTYDTNNYRLTQTENGESKTTVDVRTTYGSSTPTTSSVTVSRSSGTSSYGYKFNVNNVMTSMTGPSSMSVSVTPYTTSGKQHLPQKITTNSTNISNIEYDSNGNVTRVDMKGDGKTLTSYYEYDTMNNLTSVTDPKGYTTTYSYDSKGNLTGFSAPEGVASSLSVNSKGLVTTATNPMGVKTNYDYNSYGNLISTTLPALSLSTSAEYDETSRLISVTDALGRKISFVYNNNDFMTSETDPEGHSTSYAYDANCNLTSITNAKGGVTSMSYDNVTDWLTSVEFAGATRRYEYNKDGSLSSFTKPDGTTLSYSYDNLGRVMNDGINSYGYDDKLRLSSVSGNNKTLSFSYDGFNRVIGTNCNGHSNSYTYDDNGNCTSVNNTTYGYDKLNRLTSVKFNGKTITYSYRKDSQLSEVSYPNGMTTSFGYDAVGRLTSKKTTLSNGTVVASYSFELDKVGNITKQTKKEPYEGISLSNEDVSYTYNSGNRITKAGDISFTFDANGNTTKRGGETYSWDELDRLTKAGSTTLTYDPLGLIASYGDITFTTDPLGIGNVLSDSKSTLRQQLGVNIINIKPQIVDSLSFGNVLSDSEGAKYFYGLGLEARVKNGKISYYVTDVRGSVVAIVDENGNITHKYQYDEFGNVTQKQEADYNPFQYVGKYGVMYLNDHLYYMRARHYDPIIGRFLSEDPIWSTNLYPYAENNPIMGIDPKGESIMKYVGYTMVGGFAGSVGGLILGTVAAVPFPAAAPATMAGGSIGGGIIGAGAGAYLAYKSDHKKKESYEDIMNNGAVIYNGIIKIGDTLTPKTE